MYIIHLTSNPNQHFKCTIPIDGKNRTFIFNLRFNEMAGYWVMSVTDDITGKLLVTSIPMLTEVNILEQFTYKNIGGAVICKIYPDNTDDNASGDNLGTDFIMVWGDPL